VAHGTIGVASCGQCAANIDAERPDQLENQGLLRKLQPAIRLEPMTCRLRITIPGNGKLPPSPLIASPAAWQFSSV
jgi:hypothetical protein